MSRLIDADALIEELEADAEQIEDSISKMVHYAIIKDIEDMPTIDAVEVVRCKDCKWLDTDNAGEVYCSLLEGRYIDDDEDVGFCSYGERG